MASSATSVPSSDSLHTQSSSKWSFVESLLAKFLPVARGQDSTKIIGDQRRIIAEARNNNAKEKRNKDKILALCVQSIATGGKYIKTTKKVVLIRQLIESSDCSTDSHIFIRAVEHLEKYIGTSFSSIEDIENKCAEILPATRRIVYELGGIPWEDFAKYLYVAKNRVAVNEDVPFDEVVCAKILLRWIQAATGTKTAIFLMQAVRDLNKKQIEDEMQFLNMADVEETARSTVQLPVKDNAHDVPEDTTDRDCEIILSETQTICRQLLGEDNVDMRSALVYMSLEKHKQLQEFKNTLTYNPSSPGIDSPDINTHKNSTFFSVMYLILYWSLLFYSAGYLCLRMFHNGT